MIVKICGITNREDALIAIKHGANAIGFNFYPKSPRYIAAPAAAQIAKLLPAAITTVGVFVNETPARIAEIAGQVRLDVAQLHGDESPDGYPAGMRVWKATRVDGAFDWSRYADHTAEAFLLDGPAGALYGGAGHTFDWSAVAAGGRNIIIAGGLDASNVRDAIAQARPWGIDACSRLESAPGKKDHEKVAAFLRAALERS